eukprot:SAG31_NODE_681_length_12844_cov_31.703021_5_plen_48_part_00
MQNLGLQKESIEELFLKLEDLDLLDHFGERIAASVPGCLDASKFVPS